MLADGESSTSTVRPPSEVLVSVADIAMTNAGEPATNGEWIESGSNTIVLLRGQTAVRVARQPTTSAGMLRSQALIDHLPNLPFDVPRSVGQSATLGGYLAIPTRRLQGDPHPPGRGDATVLRQLLTAIHGVDPTTIQPYLAEARAFTGGAAWEMVLRDEVIPRLAPEVRDTARSRVEALAQLDSPRLVVNHGDLAGSNVLWSGGKVAGVLDWDLTALDDPAEDIAALAWWHGWSLLAELTDPATAARAGIFRLTFSLQAVGFALINNRPDGELETTIARAEQDLRLTSPKQN